MNAKELSSRLHSLTDYELGKLAEIYSQTGQHKKGALIASEMERRMSQSLADGEGRESDREALHQQKLL